MYFFEEYAIIYLEKTFYIVAHYVRYFKGGKIMKKKIASGLFLGLLVVGIGQQVSAAGCGVYEIVGHNPSYCSSQKCSWPSKKKSLLQTVHLKRKCVNAANVVRIERKKSSRNLGCEC